MSYDIRKTNGKEVIPGGLDDETVDTERLSGIALIGYLTPNYGREQSENFVHLAENFANKKFPENPIKGQLFYKYSDDEPKNSLYLCVDETEGLNDNIRWKKLPLVYVGDNEPAGNWKTGDMWYNSNNKSFNMYDESLNSWVKIGPEDYKKTETKIVSNEGASSNDLIIMDFDNYDVQTSYLVTIEVVGKEYNDQNYLDICATGAWKIQLLINSYRKNSQLPKIEIVGQPDYELIGTNNNSWNVNVELNNNKLVVKPEGEGFNTSSSIRWIAKVDILKVKK